MPRPYKRHSPPARASRTEQDLTGLVDDLGRVRAQLAALRAQEAHLRSVFAQHAPGVLHGTSHDVVVMQDNRRSFDPDALPGHIRNDPRYWRHTDVPVVRTVPRAQLPRFLCDPAAGLAQVAAAQVTP